MTFPTHITVSGKPDVKHLLCCVRRKLMYHSLHLLHTIVEVFKRWKQKIQELDGSQIYF